MNFKNTVLSKRNQTLCYILYDCMYTSNVRAKLDRLESGQDPRNRGGGEGCGYKRGTGELCFMGDGACILFMEAAVPK